MIPPWGFCVRERETINHISIPWLDFRLFLIFLLIKVMTFVDRKTNSLANAITRENVNINGMTKQEQVRIQRK